MDETKKTIAEWGILKGFAVLDPDGFDRSDPQLMERRFTEKEFDEGAMMSTIVPQEIAHQ